MTIYTLQPGAPAIQVVYSASGQRAAPNAPVARYLIANLDGLNAVSYGPADATRQQPDLTADATRSILAAAQNTTVSSERDWYAQLPATATGPVQLDVVPYGEAQSPAPLATETALISSGIAAVIAQAILQGGFSLVASPQLLYNGGIQNTGGTPAGWGVTISDGVPAQYTPGAKNDAAGFDSAFTAFDGIIGTPSKATKLFYDASQYPQNLLPPGPTNPNGMKSDQAGKFQACLDQGHRMYLCYQPGSTGNPGVGANQTAADAAALLASVNALNALIVAAGTGATLAAVILYQEFNDTQHATSAAVYQGGFQYYANTGPSPLRPTYKVYACLGSGNAAVWNTYVTAAITCDGLAVDFYATAYKSTTTGTRLDSGQNGGANVGGVDNNIVAIANALNVPMGIFEMGSVASGATPTNAVVTAYINYCQTVMVNRLLNLKQNLDCMWFDGQSGGANIILSNTDFRVVPLQQFIAAITTTPTTGVAAGATATIPPLQGSSVAGYATANGLSYDITVNLVASAGSTVPFMNVTLNWFNQDSLTAQPVSVQTWTLPAGTTGTVGTTTIGAGPQRGQFLQVQVTNLDSVQMSVFVQLNNTARTVERDSWTWDVGASVTVPTYLLSNPPPYSSQLCLQSQSSVPAGSTFKRLCSLFAGDVFVRFSGNAAGQLTIELNPQPQLNGAGGVAQGGADLLSATPSGAAGEFETIIRTPRAPCLLTVTNSDGAAAHSFSARIVALQ